MLLDRNLEPCPAREDWASICEPKGVYGKVACYSDISLCYQRQALQVNRRALIGLTVALALAIISLASTAIGIYLRQNP